MTAGFLAVLPYLVLILAFAADRLSKWWMAAFLAENGPTEVNAFLTLLPTYNRGIAFGMFQGLGPAVGWVSILIVAAMFVYMVRLPRQLWLLRSGLAMMIGGAVGNQIDRLLDGQVLDFIQIPLRPGIFNVADVMINLGLVLCLVSFVVHRRAMNEKSEETPESTQELEGSEPIPAGEELADS